MRTNLRIPIDGIVSFSWHKIAEAASPIQLAISQKWQVELASITYIRKLASNFIDFFPQRSFTDVNLR